MKTPRTAFDLNAPSFQEIVNFRSYEMKKRNLQRFVWIEPPLPPPPTISEFFSLKFTHVTEFRRP